MLGERLGHYRILDRLGAGGMGVVYRAHDDRLDRDVAVKVLPPGTLADDTVRRRFHKEAQALAKLSHSNIGVIYDVGSEEGTDYLVMELIPGGSLADRLSAGPLPEKDVARLGMQIAAALEEAHEQGVVHCDLKPGNVMVTPKSQVKVVDFGLARLGRPEVSAHMATASLTQTPAAAGTLPYMAPEQLRGEAADPRTDVYALGTVLYEMATGQRPFRDELVPRLTDAILHQEPIPPGRFRPELTAELERIILKCLDKDPGNRYQSAKELGVDLRRSQQPRSSSSVTAAAPVRASARRRWLLAAGGLAVLAALLVTLNVGGWRDRLVRSAASAAPIHSLAVLPLENLSRDTQQDFFADGMTEAVITELSKISALKVISRTSVMRYKSARKPLPEIAGELRVDAVVTGSVLREGDQVRVTVQLIRGATDQLLWANSFQREMRSILSLQGEIAAAIAGEVRIAVTPDEQKRLGRPGDVNPEVHDLTLKGRFLLNQEMTNRESLELSAATFRRALELDPTHAPGYAGLSHAYQLIARAGYKPMQLACPEFRAAVEKAIELDPSLGDAYTARAAAKFSCDWDWAGAEADARRALQLAPGSATAEDMLAYILSPLGRHQEALDHSRRAQQLDPLNINVNVQRAMYFYHARRFEEALAEIRKTLAFAPESLFTKWQMGVILTAMGRHDEAIQTFLSRKVATADTNWMLGYTYGRAGRRGEALRVVNFLLERRKQQFIWPAIIAVVYIGMGDRDKAFEWLETAYREREVWLQDLKVSPMYDPIRSDPRFADLVARMRFP